MAPLILFQAQKFQTHLCCGKQLLGKYREADNSRKKIYCVYYKSTKKKKNIKEEMILKHLNLKNKEKRKLARMKEIYNRKGPDQQLMKSIRRDSFITPLTNMH